MTPSTLRHIFSQHVNNHSAWRWSVRSLQQAWFTSTSNNSSSSTHDRAVPLVVKEPETPLLQTIRNRIMVRGGPLSVSEYMQEVLTNPHAGYYMKRDVFGSKGDFITAPEISQVVGELIGIWCVLVWQSLGSPSSLNLVELGPGRGTLMADLLRGTAGFSTFAESLKVHLVEVSPYMRQQQWNKLQCTATGSSSSDGRNQQQQQQQHEISSGISGLNGAQVTWHSSLDAVPNTPTTPSLYIAHEFLDALPVHQFVKDDRRGWLEVMVDAAEEHDLEDSTSSSSSSSSSNSSIDGIPLVQQQQQPPPGRQQQPDGPHHQQQQDSQLHLRYVLSPKPTPASQLLVPRRLAALHHQQQQQYNEPATIEIGAHAMAVCEMLARRIAATGGAALLIDYGKNEPYGNSLTAIRNHKGVHPLSQPGTADLSAWVDFSAMRLAAEQAHELQQTAAAAAATTPKQTAAAELSVQEMQQQSLAAGIDVHGPINQADLLHGLGIQHRLEALAQGATPAQIENLISAYKRLVDTGPNGMGAAYLALAITQKGLQVPVPFEQESS